MCNCLSAQDPFFRQYTIENGLPSNNVFTVIQDSKGHIWVGTDKGVCKFDGKGFTVFTYSQGLEDNFVHNLIEDSEGRMWLLPINGKLSFIKDNRIHNSLNDPFLRDIDIRGPVIHAIKDRVGNIWIVGKKVIRINKSEKEILDVSEFLKYGVPLEQSSILIQPWLSDGKMRFFDRSYNEWIWDGKFVLAKNNQLNLSKLRPILEKNSFRNLNRGKIIVHSGNQIYILKGGEVLYRTVYNSKLTFNNVFEENNGDIYLCTNQGLLKFDSTLKFKGNILEKYSVNYTYKDHEGNLWISTVFNGLIMVPDDEILIFTTEKLGANKISRINFTDDIKLAGTADGKLYQFSDTGLKLLYTSQYAQAIYEIIIDGREYGAVLPRELLWFDSRGRHVYTDIDFNKTIYKARDRTLYLGCGGRLISYSKKSKKIYEFKEFPYRIFGLAEDEVGLLAGTENGLARFNDGKLIPLKSHPLFLQPVNMMRSDKRNAVWIASRTKGIIVKYHNFVLSLSEKYGLESEISRLEISGNRVFAVGMNSVYRIDFSMRSNKIQIHKIEKLPLLPAMHIGDIAVTNEILWIASNKGIIKYPLNLSKGTAGPTELIITGVIINQADSSIRSSYTLNYKKNNITVMFSGLTYRNTEDLNYRYRINGKGVEWNYTSIPQVTFLELSPGDYRFEVQVQNANGTWNPEIKTIDFNISGPFWKRGWFIVSILILLGLILFWYFRSRIRTLKYQESIKLSAVQAELHALRSEMNPHFVFNALNSIHAYVMDHQTEEAEHFLGSFSSLMRMAFENTRKPHIPLSEEIRFLEAYIKIEQQRMQNSFDYNIKIDKKIDLNNSDFPSMFLQPFVENAIQHGLKNMPNGLLNLEFIINGKADLVCFVEDNGRGRKQSESGKSAKHLSTSMDIVNKRVENYHSEGKYHIQIDVMDKKDEAGNASGTKISVRFLNYFN